MSKLVTTVILMLSCLAFYALAAGETVNFSGSWILNTAKSDPAPRSLRAMNESGVGDVSGGGMRGGGMPGGGMPGGFGGGMPGGGMGGGFGRGPGGGPVPLVIEQNGNEIKIKNGFMAENLTCDGKQYEKETPMPGSDVKLKEKTKAALKKNKLVVEKINFSPPMGGQSGVSQMQTLTKRTYSLSEDGKTLTLETSTENTMMSTIQKQVYQKQETQQ
jgi:hypothetical protein